VPLQPDRFLAIEHTFVPCSGVTDYDLDAHARLLDVGELDDRLPDVPRVQEALRVLVGDGLAMQLGDRVGGSRAAVRFDALTPV
jgi:hypothetical protein